MLRRLSSSSSLLQRSNNSLRHMSDSIERGPSNATRFMCDTTDGAYNSMVLGNTTTSATAAANHHAHGGVRTAKPAGSIFGDSPAAVGTSLIGCLCFGATYGYYIGGAVMQASNDKRA